MKKTQYTAPETVSMNLQSAISLCVVFSGGGGDSSFFNMGEGTMNGLNAI